MLDVLLVYVPLTIIGLWRWSYWLVRAIGASLYRRQTKPLLIRGQKFTTSVVTPVYNEDPKIFRAALDSWIANGVDEIIAVIDKTNARLIVEFERHYVRGDHKTKCRLIVTPKPGKRAALCDGISRSKGDLIALADSDTSWSKNVVSEAAAQFNNPAIGGVTVPQRISNPKTTSNVLFDIMLWDRYHTEVPFLLAVGGVFNTLSGRTALYRRDTLLNSMYDNLHHLRHEFFLGTRGISGDDKRLTHLILEQGWKVGFASGASVYTTGLSRMPIFLKQRLRWIRNSWRAEFRAMKRGWVWRFPVLAYFIIDRFFLPFFMLLGPVALVVLVANHRWLLAGILIGWWVISRFIKLYGYFRRHPKRLIYLPAYIIYSYVNALLKIYAIATIVEHNWVTRWHKSRNRKSFLRKTVLAGSGTAAIVLVVFGTFAYANRLAKSAALSVSRPAAVSQGEFKAPAELAAKSSPSASTPSGAVFPDEVKIYIAKPGDTLSSIGDSFGISYQTLKKLNGIIDPDKINPGQKIFYYSPEGDIE